MKRVCSQCEKKRDETKFVSARGRICETCRRQNQRERARTTHLAKTYNVTVAEYEAIVEAQGGVCGICKGARPYNLAIDHDHAIAEQFGVRESVRGALCKRCNRLLRDVRDDPQILGAAVSYLNLPPAKGVLFP